MLSSTTISPPSKKTPSPLTSPNPQNSVKPLPEPTEAVVGADVVAAVAVAVQAQAKSPRQPIIRPRPRTSTKQRRTPTTIATTKTPAANLVPVRSSQHPKPHPLHV